MATILLSAVGAAAGGALGGGVFGLSSVVIGRAIGATIGRAIDNRLMGAGSETVETGRMDNLRLMGANEGAAIPRVFGRTRVAGNVIWASRYKEAVTVSESSGGKGAPKGPTTRSYSYSVSVAIALCEGEIARVGRIWADGVIVDQSEITMRVYRGTQDQLPDPLITAIEGADVVPAYRGLAYVVFEWLDVAPFGNRVPQFTFEVVRPAKSDTASDVPAMPDVVQGVAMMPGTGEYALASSSVYLREADGTEKAVNANTASGGTDLAGSLAALTGELPNCKATSLVVSWFGDDLRIGSCSVKPKVERAISSGPVSGSSPVFADDELNAWPERSAAASHGWDVSGVGRADAEAVAQIDGRPVYGGTPADGSVVEAIHALQDSGQAVMFYPFLLMEILEGNTLPNPWTGAAGQPPLPWRGRIRSDADGTSAARAQVDQFMGDAQVGDFSISGNRVLYGGSGSWGYRRFILHYAYLCAAAGGVDAFCIGSEMRAMTQIRDETGAFPAVEALKLLAAEVHSILGPETKISYAADWSEYFGYQPQDGSGDVIFHLDPLWADPAIDFIGIDNYMPISDWRDGSDHLDAEAGSIYNLDYLASNIAGGEGYDWYYRDSEERSLQIRTPIEDGAYGEPWIYRNKDLVNWWSERHYNRRGGTRQTEPTAWEPQSKPFWFTELGCAAIDKGPNQPNKFLDPKSSESAIPYFSSGRRDDYVQAQYLRAYARHFDDAANNPVSEIYDGPMVDMSRCYIWAWDARPWPDFPSNLALWSDGDNHVTGHWLTGRSGTQPLAFVVAELCEQSGITNYDVSELHGVVRGFALGDAETGRASLQILMLAYAFDAIETNGMIQFKMRALADEVAVERSEMVTSSENDIVLEQTRAPEAEVVGEVRLGYTEAEGEFQARVADARFPDDGVSDTTQNEVALALTATEAGGIAERWLSEARVARDKVAFSLPASRSDLRVGDLARLTDAGGTDTLYRVDRIEDRGARQIEAVRVEPQLYAPSDAVEEVAELRPFTVPIPVSAQFMDLPLLTGEEIPHAPHVAAAASPWPGGAALYSSSEDAGYQLNTVVEFPATVGHLQSALLHGRPGLWDRAALVRVQLSSGALSAQSRAAVLNGANVAAIGDGTSNNWEIIQFAGAELIDGNVYALNDLLRGQAGTDGNIPDHWPAGSRFVLLDSAVTQIGLDLSSRDLSRHYRVGPSLRPYDDPSFRHYIEAFQGIGLRPYAPAHLKALRRAGVLEIGWVRRTRIDGDSWASVEVPLGEEGESYLLRISKEGAVLREEVLSEASWSYPVAAQQADGADGEISIEVAQISQSFGPGHFARIVVNV